MSRTRYIILTALIILLSLLLASSALAGIKSGGKKWRAVAVAHSIV